MRCSAHTSEASDFWKISYAITGFFTAGETEVSLAAATLKLLADHLDWNAGTFWIVNELRMVLECADFYAQPKPLPLETVTRARHFGAGEGLPGIAWLKRELMHIPDVCQSQNFPRASVAEIENLHAGVAFPLYVGKAMFGVIELFSHDMREIYHLRPGSFSPHWADRSESAWRDSPPDRRWKQLKRSFSL